MATEMENFANFSVEFFPVVGIFGRLALYEGQTFSHDLTRHASLLMLCHPNCRIHEVGRIKNLQGGGPPLTPEMG